LDYKNALYDLKRNKTSSEEFNKLMDKPIPKLEELADKLEFNPNPSESLQLIRDVTVAVTKIVQNFQDLLRIQEDLKTNLTSVDQRWRANPNENGLVNEINQLTPKVQQAFCNPSAQNLMNEIMQLIIELRKQLKNYSTRDRSATEIINEIQQLIKTDITGNSQLLEIATMMAELQKTINSQINVNQFIEKIDYLINDWFKCDPYYPDNDAITTLAEYLNKTTQTNKRFVAAYFLCVVLNLINVIVQMYFTDLFLRGEFVQYGLEVFKFQMTDQINRTDPMVEVFPLMTKCTLPRYGVGGSIELRDILCVMPVNVINEKIFIFLWFWYIILAVLSSLAILYWILLMASGRVRRNNLCTQQTEEVKDILKRLQPKCHDLSYWFQLWLLQKNLNSVDFRLLLEKIDELTSTELPPNESFENEEKQTFLTNITLHSQNFDKEKKYMY